jgi:processive 1,2-diacylglycerol beta-glucosyltransferase
MRVLIPTVTAGAGHLQAAIALEEAWKARRPEDQVRRIDVLDYTPRLYRKIYVKGYLKLIEHAPELYAMMFKKTDNPARIRELTKFRRQSARMTAARFVRDMIAFKPDVFIAPHYLPLEILGGVQSRRRFADVDPFTVCIVTDFEAHALWMESCVDLYCVAAEETKARLLARGAAENAVAVTGIPVAEKFTRRVDQAAIRHTLGLDSKIRTLLVLGGGFGIGPVAEIIAELDKTDSQFQMIVVCGKNEALRRTLAALQTRHSICVLGFVTNMHELMAVSDLILTTPGGLTTSEALAMGKPLLILSPIPGQEAANSDFLLEHGAAAKVNCLEDLPYKVRQLLDPRKLADKARAARLLGKPSAALDICAEIIDRLEDV